QAPADLTWEAVLAHFAEDSIPIQAVERAYGRITSDEVRVGSDGREMADCGKVQSLRLYPNVARYNATVWGDSPSSNVKVTVVWSHRGDTANVKDCSTTHKFERAFEESVKSWAEDSSAVLAGEVRPSRRRKSAGASPRSSGTDHLVLPDTTNLD